MKGEKTKSQGAAKRTKKNKVGVSVGVTLNMGNYESIRLDAWAEADYTGGKEGREKAIIDLFTEVERIVDEKALSYKALLKNGGVSVEK